MIKPGQGPALFVDHVVMRAAQENQVGQRRLAAIDPVL